MKISTSNFPNMDFFIEETLQNFELSDYIEIFKSKFKLYDFTIIIILLECIKYNLQKITENKLKQKLLCLKYSNH